MIDSFCLSRLLFMCFFNMNYCWMNRQVNQVNLDLRFASNFYCCFILQEEIQCFVCKKMFNRLKQDTITFRF